MWHHLTLALSLAVLPLAPADRSIVQDDLTSIDGVVKAVYGVISGPKGQKRDWDRMRSLFVPEARLIATGLRRDGTVSKTAMTVEEYITRSGPFLEENGFFEKEVHRAADQYGNVAHLFSTYEARRAAEDEKPFMRGINSFQLWNDGKRWWVVTIFWRSEDSENPIPAKYLGGR